ncbi:MAG: PAS domain S-box protein [Candidatus Freyarchaeum deiterrae]
MGKLVEKTEPVKMRKSGIEVLGDIPWGTHLCQFYETKEDLLDILVPYFAEGLRDNEYCIWVTAPPLDTEEARASLQEAVTELENYVEKGQIEILPYTDWYLLNGEFDENRVLNGWVEKEKSALERGFEGIRLTGNFIWSEKKFWKKFVAYDAKISEIIGRHRMIAICAYSLEKCTGNDIADVIRNHGNALIRKGKSWFLVEDSSKHRLEDNKVVGSLTKLMRSEEKYRQLIENLNEGIWLIDKESRTTFCNERISEILGYTVDEMIGRNLFSFMDEHGVEIAKKLLERRREGVREDHDFEFIRKDGARIYTRLGTSPIIDENGNYAGALAAVIDITERRRMEEELENSEKRYKELFNNTGDAIFIHDLEGKFLEVNRVACERLGYSREEFLRMSPMDIDTPEYAAIVPERMEELRQKGQIIFETAHLRRDGCDCIRIPTELSSCLIEYDGKPAILSIARDITERKRMEEELRRYSEHLEELVEERTRKLREAERMAAIGETAAMVGHDLRNPLQSIFGLLYLANKNLNSQATSNGKQKNDLAELLQTIEGQVDYMNKIVSDLEDYAKPVNPQLVATSVHQLIDDTFSARTIPENVRVYMGIEEDLQLAIDPTMMRRVLANLIENAVQAMPNGGQLKIKASKKGDSVLIGVEDTGVGIPGENLSKLFQPLFTTKAKGQGLGLAVCNRLVEAHGGSITVESEVGKGSTFTVEIPLKKMN